LANRVISDHSGNTKTLSDFGQERLYPYTYPFYYAGEAIPRNIGDHSANVRAQS